MQRQRWPRRGLRAVVMGNGEQPGYLGGTVWVTITLGLHRHGSLQLWPSARCHVPFMSKFLAGSVVPNILKNTSQGKSLDLAAEVRDRQSGGL